MNVIQICYNRTQIHTGSVESQNTTVAILTPCLTN